MLRAYKPSSQWSGWRGMCSQWIGKSGFSSKRWETRHLRSLLGQAESSRRGTAPKRGKGTAQKGPRSRLQIKNADFTCKRRLKLMACELGPRLGSNPKSNPDP